MFNRSRALLAAMVALASPFSSMAGAEYKHVGYNFPRNRNRAATTAAAQRRAKIKRANIRKHPRCRS